MTGRRVVSLVPSSTETLLALGADVVACTRFCEQPDLRHVGGTKNPDVAAIIALDPDLVVLDREENRREDAEALTAAGLDVVVSDVHTVADSARLVGELADLLGVEAPEAAASPEVAAAPEALSPAQRTAFVPIWRRPWMSINASTYGASLLAGIGVHLVTADAPDPYPVVELHEVAARAPDLVLVPSEPYDFRPQHLDELRRAMPAARLLELDGRDLFWWGIRTPAARDRLDATIHAGLA